jgi:acyl-ACP thioesterase
MVPAPAEGRVYVFGAIPGLGDVTAAGRARLDAIARWLQDAAWADVHDSEVPDEGSWVIRRMTLRVDAFPVFWEPLEVATFCSGTGPLWAERRTTIRGAEGAHVEAVAVWVHLDGRVARPRPLPAGFEAVYGAAAAGRRVRARLRHPAEPPESAGTRSWTFRVADVDLADHVNNAVYWAVVEEELAGEHPGDGFGADIEHRAPGSPGPATVAADGAMRWISDPGGAVLATIELPAGRRGA